METHRAGLFPQLNLAKSQARREPAYAKLEGNLGVLGNGFIEASIDFGQACHDRAIVLNKLSGESHELQFSPLEAVFDSGAVSVADARVKQVEARGSGDVSTLTTHVDCGWLEMALSYVLFRGEHFLRKSAVLHHIERKAHLEKVTITKRLVEKDLDILLHDGGMYFPIVFVRSRKGGMFYCVDFPGYHASQDGRWFQFDYYPGCDLEPGRSHQIPTALIGVYKLCGRTRVNPFHDTAAELDVGEQEWFREFLLCGNPPTQLPQVELEGSAINTEGPSDLEVLDQCRWFGATRVLLPRTLESTDSYPLGDIIDSRAQTDNIGRILRVSKETARNLKWTAIAKDGAAATPDQAPCFACEDYCKFIVDHYLDIMEKHQFRDIEVTASPIMECHATSHGHAPGMESLQKAFQGLVEVIATLRENYTHVRCAAPYGNYGAGLARMCECLSLTGEEHPLPLPDIHLARLFADRERLYFRRAHSFLLPRTKLISSVGFRPGSAPDAAYPGAEKYPWHLYHDSAGWRYALISSIATTPRHRLRSLPQNLPEEDRAFAGKWIAWERQNLADFSHVEEILGEPGLHNVDGYSYTTGHKAVVFLFNSTYDPQDVHLQLRLEHDSDYIVREIHPRELNYLGPSDGLFRRDSRIAITLGPREARVIEAVRHSPASAKRIQPEVFGAPTRTVKGKTMVLGGPGERLTIGTRSRDGFLRRTIPFPGKPVQTHITSWTVQQRPFGKGEATLPKGGFAGTPLSSDERAQRDVWLSATASFPTELAHHVDTSPFELIRPVWTYPDRLFFVIRFEPECAFDPIRTSSGVAGIPEGHFDALPIKCGIDLAPRDYGPRAWVNGVERKVYPAMAAWKGFSPNPNPVVAYFFEAGSALEFGPANSVVLFCKHFEAAAFKGVFVEHVPEITIERAVDSP